MTDSQNIGGSASGREGQVVLSATSRDGTLSPQFLLGQERQLTLDGGEEPLRALRVEPKPDQEQEPSPAQAGLFDWPQPELPLHQKVDGKIPGDCLRGWHYRQEAHAREVQAARLAPECCGRQNCECSREGNDAERSRDLWNGTKGKGRAEKERIGLRHVLGGAALGVLVVTLPEGRRPKKQDAKKVMKAWERAVVGCLVRCLRKHVGVEDAEFYIRANIHPCGENATVWYPHLNLMVPCWFFSPGTKQAKRLNPFIDVDGLRAELGAEMVRVFGERAEGEAVNCHWQYEQEEAGKRHQASYVPRTFPEWAYLKLRPATYGLAHPRKRAELVRALEALGMPALAPWASVELLPGHDSVLVSGWGKTEAEAQEDLLGQLENHRATCPTCLGRYPDYRRTMVAPGRMGGPAPPGQGPPGYVLAAINAQAA